MPGYPIDLIHDPETRAILVEFPDIPFAHSVGDSEEEALLNAADALESALEIYLEENRAAPLPSGVAPGQFKVRLPALITAKVLLWNEMQAQGVDKAELARRLGWPLLEVEGLFHLRDAMRIERVEMALAGLGRYLEIGLAA